MSDTPDLNKIIGLILENPSLVEQISALAKQNTDDVTEDKESAPVISEQESSPVSVSVTEARGDKRTRLLSAMKPYLSESRGKAIDSMLGIVGILDMMKGGE